MPRKTQLLVIGTYWSPKAYDSKEYRYYTCAVTDEFKRTRIYGKKKREYQLTKLGFLYDSRTDDIYDWLHEEIC